MTHNTGTGAINFDHTIVHNVNGDSMVSFADLPQENFDALAQGFTPRATDVFIATYPRSGTTWTRQIVHLLINRGEQGDTDFYQTVPYLEFSLTGLSAAEHVQYLMELTTQRYLATHLPYNFMPRSQAEQGRYIYVARNPKDCAVSCYYFYRSLDVIGFTGSWDDFFELFVGGHTGYGNYFDHVLDWWRASRQTDKILFLTYEQMYQDLPGVIAQIAAFIDLPVTPEIVAATATQTQFDTMRQNPKANMDDVIVPRPEFPHKHLRKGKVGDWRTLFSREQNDRMDAVCQNKWVAVGLEFAFV